MCAALCAGHYLLHVSQQTQTATSKVPCIPASLPCVQLPLEAAATLSKEDARYLQKRQRSSWWRRSKFPQVPADTTAERNPPALQVLLLRRRRWLGWLGHWRRLGLGLDCGGCTICQSGPPLVPMPCKLRAPCPRPLQLWGKVLPLGLIFFVASFNLTILQVSCREAAAC